MNKDLLKFMQDNNIDDGILREFLFKDNMQAASVQVHIMWERYLVVIKKIQELDNMINDIVKNKMSEE